MDCGAKLAFGSMKKGGGLFPKRKDGDTWLPDNGWLNGIKDQGYGIEIHPSLVHSRFKLLSLHGEQNAPRFLFQVLYSKVKAVLSLLLLFRRN